MIITVYRAFYNMRRQVERISISIGYLRMFSKSGSQAKLTYLYIYIYICVIVCAALNYQTKSVIEAHQPFSIRIHEYSDRFERYVCNIIQESRREHEYLLSMKVK